MKKIGRLYWSLALRRPAGSLIQGKISNLGVEKGVTRPHTIGILLSISKQSEIVITTSIVP